MFGNSGRAACVWNPPGWETTCRPETTLTSENPIAAFEATLTFAHRRVGVRAQTLFTVTSRDPKPTVTGPSTKCVFVASIWTYEELPADRAVGLTVAMNGAALPTG